GSTPRTLSQRAEPASSPCTAPSCNPQRLQVANDEDRPGGEPLRILHRGSRKLRLLRSDSPSSLRNTLREAGVLEVESGLDLSLAVDGRKLRGDLAKVGGAKRGGRERRLDAVERVEVVHTHGEGGSLGDTEQLLDAQILHRVPGTANRVIRAPCITQHILAAGITPGVGAEQLR